MGDDVFQLDNLVDPYRVVSSNDLEEKSKFCIAENTLVNVDIGDLNGVLRTNGHIEVDGDDDSDEINVKDCNGDDLVRCYISESWKRIIANATDFLFLFSRFSFLKKI